MKPKDIESLQNEIDRLEKLQADYESGFSEKIAGIKDSITFRNLFGWLFRDFSLDRSLFKILGTAAAGYFVKDGLSAMLRRFFRKD